MKFIWCLFLIALVGCAYASKTTIQVRGDKIHFPIAGIRTLQGEKMEVLIIREMKINMKEKIKNGQIRD